MTTATVLEIVNKRLEIIVSTNQRDVVDQAEAALLRLGGVYTRARTLVHVVRDVGESHDLQYPEGQPVIARLGRERMRELCGAAATWLVKRTKRGEEMLVESLTPPWVPATLEQRGEWRFPALDGVSDAPVFRADGSVHDRPGYDLATRIIYEPGGVVYPPVPSTPTAEDADAALGALLDPFVDFPAVADSDRSALIALVLTLVARAAIEGPTPLFLVRAPTPGSGKGLSLDAAAMIATGRLAPKRPPVANDDELRKAMLAYAIESPALIVLDNVAGSLGSPTLAFALTAGTLTDRLLGASESRTVPLRFVMAATGNNVQLRGDTGRRVIPIDLDPRVEHPEDRGGWRYPNLLDHLRVERPRLIAAALTILRGFVVAGRPDHGKPTKGSFEAWDRLVRGAIVWAGGADPLGGVQRIRDDGDEDLERLRALLVAWDASLGSMPTTVADAIKRSGDGGPLHEALTAYSRGGKLDTKAIGHALKAQRGRIVGGMELVRDSLDRNGVARWLVRTVES
ncbi:MAG TPA: hypothetical protein VGG74_24645 [Kofleriaceae bacterium]